MIPATSKIVNTKIIPCTNKVVIGDQNIFMKNENLEIGKSQDGMTKEAENIVGSQIGES